MAGPIENFLNGKVKNSSGESMPAWSLVPIVSPGASVVEGIGRSVGGKPSTTFSQIYVVSGKGVIGNGLTGLCQVGPLVIVKYNGSDPTFGDRYGAKPSQWTAEPKYPTCLMCHGIYDSTKKLMLARLVPVMQGRAKADGTIANDATSGTISLWTGTWGVDTTVNITGARNVGPSVASGDKLSWFDLDGEVCFGKLCSS